MYGVIFDIDLPTLVIALSVIAAAGVQFLLCRKSQRTVVKLLPAVVFALCAAVFFVLSAAVNGWDGLGYLFFGLLSAGLIFVCGIAWAVCAIIAKNK
ncbi:MAG: hypothetical protein IJE90_04785 [Clostridia bacterium]|nr:hypothetical protein [Clostridia bacterium]